MHNSLLHNLALLDERARNKPLEYVQWTKPQYCFLTCADKYRLLRTGNQLGKFLSNDTLIRIPDGWKPIGEIQEGELVMAGDGSFVEVLEVHPQGIQPCYRVTFNDGASVLAGGPHLWSVKGSSGVALVTTDTLREMVKYEHVSIPLMGTPLVYDERLVTAIEPAGEYDCTCISIAHPDGLYVCTKDYIVTHNTYCGAADIIWRCLGTHPYLVTPEPPIEAWVICSSWSQSISIQKKIWGLLPKHEISEDSNFNPKNGFTGVQKAIHFKNGSILRVKTVNQDTMDLESATIHHVWIDEPIGDEEAFSALQARLRRTGGTIAITMTPATSGDLTWLRKLSEEEKIKDLHFPLTAENLIPVGSNRPLRTEDGIPMDESWVAEQIASTMPWAVPVRCHGEWEFARVDHWFESFRDSFIVKGLVSSGRLGRVKLYLGLDYGDGKNRVAGILVAVDDTGEHPKIYVLREYVPLESTTPDMDAQGLVDMIKSAGLSWQRLDRVYGDKSYTDSKGKIVLKSNAQMTAAVGNILGVGTRLSPPFYGAKNGEGNRPGSVEAGCKFLHWAMIRADHFFVDSSCTWLIESLKKWDGTATDKHKDIIDALRYALKDYIFKTNRASSVVTTLRIGQ